MSQRTALNTLQVLAKRESDSAVRLLSSAIEQHGHARQRLDMLMDLRAEYTQRLQQQSAAGISIMAIRNYQAFMEKIDHAIAGQQRLEAAATARVEQTRAGWQSKKRTEKTWELLIRRGVRADALKALTQERKLMDEFASRAAYQDTDSGMDC